jgi:hypothetical protein
VFSFLPIFVLHPSYSLRHAYITNHYCVLSILSVMFDGNGIALEAARVPRTFPKFSAALVTTTLIGFLFWDTSSCSTPLGSWVAIFIIRHVIKSVLYHIRLRRVSRGEFIPSWLFMCLALVDISSPAIWALGGYFIFRTDTCDGGLFVYASILWGFQTLVLLLPCCFLSTILFCAPCLVWIAPYIVRPNPNTIATSREILSRIPKVTYGVLSLDSDSSCPICLGDYQEMDEILKLPCGHFFHGACISEWTCVSQLCPVCRDNIVIAIGKEDLIADTV